MIVEGLKIIQPLIAHPNTALAIVTIVLTVVFVASALRPKPSNVFAPFFRAKPESMLQITLDCVFSG
jgi:hypothetical protein